MVMAHIGFPAGQSVHLGDVTVLLSYFNHAMEKHKPDGIASFMFVNMSDHAQTVCVHLKWAKSSDFYKEGVLCRETLQPRSIDWKEYRSDRVKTATYARFVAYLDDPKADVTPDPIAAFKHFKLSEFNCGGAINILSEDN